MNTQQSSSISIWKTTLLLERETGRAPLARGPASESFDTEPSALKVREKSSHTIKRSGRTYLSWQQGLPTRGRSHRTATLEKSETMIMLVLWKGALNTFEKRLLR